MTEPHFRLFLQDQTSHLNTNHGISQYGSSRNLVAFPKIALILETVVMKDINTHYSQLLGLGSSWQVSKVNLDLAGNQVVIQLEHSGG